MVKSLNREKLLDVLTERLTFEREGVQLYDTIIAKMEDSRETEVRRMLDRMREHRQQEKEHEEWLEEQVRRLGGTAHERTEHSILVETESRGIEEVVQNDRQIPHLFHALLNAELVDNAGWDLLMRIAEEAGDREAAKEFKKRLFEEQEHLLYVKSALEAFTRRDVLGESLSLPTQP